MFDRLKRKELFVIDSFESLSESPRVCRSQCAHFVSDSFRASGAESHELDIFVQFD